MSNFGEINDQVVLNRDLGSRKKGTILYIYSNKIDSDNEIKVVDHIKSKNVFYVNIQTISLVKENDLLKNWNFIIHHYSQIDFNLMMSDLTKCNPILLVTTSVNDKMVLIHDSLLNKAKRLKIKKPKKCINSKSHKNVFIIKCEFSEWISWAKRVKSAKWECQNVKRIKVNVIVPTI